MVVDKRMKKIKSYFNIDNKNLPVLLFFIILVLQTFLYVLSTVYILKQMGITRDFYNLPLQCNPDGTPFDVSSRETAYFGFIAAYYISYKYGVVPRGFVNSIIYLFYMPIHALFGLFGINFSFIVAAVIFKYLLLILLDIILVNVFVKILKYLHERIGNKAYYMYFVLICVMNVYVVGFEYRYTDYVLFMLQIAGIYFAIKRKDILALLTMVLSLFVHEASLLLSCPIVFAIILARHLHDDAKSKVKSYLRMFAMGAVLLLVAMYFLKFQGYFHDESSVTQVYSDILTDMGVPVNENSLGHMDIDFKLVRQFLFNAGTTKWNNDIIADGVYDYETQFLSLLTTLFYTLTLLPITICVAKNLIKNLKNTKSVFVKFEKILIAIAGIIAMMPMIIFKEDIARWITFIWIYYAFLGFYGLYTNSEIVINVYDSIVTKVKKLLDVSKTNIVPVIIYTMAILPCGGAAINYLYIWICFHIVRPFMFGYFPGVVEKAIQIMKVLNGDF